MPSYACDKGRIHMDLLAPGSAQDAPPPRRMSRAPEEQGACRAVPATASEGSYLARFSVTGPFCGHGFAVVSPFRIVVWPTSIGLTTTGPVCFLSPMCVFNLQRELR